MFLFEKKRKENMKKKIMIIDDSKTIRKTAVLFLNQEGYEVLEVENGFEALSKVIDDVPDLLFIDVMMPRLGGYETCKIIKQNPEFESLPIVILSSKDGILDKAKGRLYGCDEYLTKPFTKDKLLEVVKKYIN